MTNRSRAHLTMLLLVFLAAAPAAGIAIWSITRTAMELADPCATWDCPPDLPVYLRVGPHDVCRAPSVHVESKKRALTRAALIPGGVLAAAMLAMAGAAMLRRRWMIAAGIAMLTEALVVFTIAPLTLIAGVSLLILSGRAQAINARV